MFVQLLSYLCVREKQFVYRFLAVSFSCLRVFSSSSGTREIGNEMVVLGFHTVRIKREVHFWHSSVVAPAWTKIHVNFCSRTATPIYNYIIYSCFRFNNSGATRWCIFVVWCGLFYVQGSIYLWVWDWWCGHWCMTQISRGKCLAPKPEGPSLQHRPTKLNVLAIS